MDQKAAQEAQSPAPTAISRRAMIKRIGKAASVAPVAVALSLTTKKAWAY